MCKSFSHLFYIKNNFLNLFKKDKKNLLVLEPDCQIMKTVWIVDVDVKSLPCLSPVEGGLQLEGTVLNSDEFGKERICRTTSSQLSHSHKLTVRFYLLSLLQRT